MDILRARRREEVLRLAKQHGAHNVRVFGSVARGEANDASDVDFLVDWEVGRSLLDQVALVQDLEEALGVKVHVGTERSLHWYVRDQILREATPLGEMTGSTSTTCWSAAGASLVSLAPAGRCSSRPRNSRTP